MKANWFGLVLLLFCVVRGFSQSVYNEQYRPQFHFSPESGWIGDPDGTIKFQDKYHLFWWGHATSQDLVYWDELSFPMKGDDGSFHYYTGSVVVDKDNTSGFGTGSNSPMVAIYTAHHKTTGLQTQRLSYSNDYTAFHYYAGNPVLDIGSKEFRDPDVFWDVQTSRWIMTITLPLERKISLYSSSDLKTWEYLSSFGPVAAQEQVWEVPQLLQLPLDGNEANRKWAMICSMGPNKMQYFTGDFDGTSFVLDNAEDNYLKKGTGLDGVVYASFEVDYESWTAEGNAFGASPASGALPNQQPLTGFLGGKLINSFLNGDASTGKLTSPTFVIEKGNINFLIGGGNHAGQTCINLIVNGSVVRTATADNSEVLKWKGWDVNALKGQQAQLQIVDSHTGGWGHINIDHIMFSDVLMNTEREHARWVDWGADFYAARAYRDYDESPSGATVWLGWMGNWEYANDVPTTWGRGAQSIPRSIGLHAVANGFELRQTPWAELEKLRSESPTLISAKSVDQVVALDEFLPSRNTYELIAEFDVNASSHVGLHLFAGPAGKVVLGYDAATSSVYLDRRFSGNISFHPKFPKINTAPLSNAGDKISFRVFVDQSSIEVFVNDGEVVFTSLVFPYDDHNHVEAFSLNGTASLNMTARNLTSIWGIEPPGPVTGIEDEIKKKIEVYPNPIKAGSGFSVRTESMLPMKLALLDAQGREVNEGLRIQNDSWVVDQSVSSGLYLLRVTTTRGVINRKILITH